MQTAAHYTADANQLNSGVVATRMLDTALKETAASAETNKALRTGRLRALVLLAKPHRSVRPDLHATFENIELPAATPPVNAEVRSSSQDSEDDDLFDRAQTNCDSDRFDDIDVILERVNSDLSRLMNAA